MQLVLSALVSCSLVLSALGFCGHWWHNLGPPPGAPIEPDGGWHLRAPFRQAALPPPGAPEFPEAPGGSLDQAYRDACQRYLASERVAQHPGGTSRLHGELAAELSRMEHFHWQYRCAFNEDWCARRQDQLQLAVACLAASLGLL
ncbi:MAG: hypothetical protein AAF430_17960 [Myxococcota bacterium]